MFITRQANPTAIVNQPANIKKIEFRWQHTLILTKDNETYGFGSGYNGQLTTEVNENKPFKILDNITRLSTGSDFSVVVKNNGDIYSFGIDDKFQLGHDISKNFYESTIAGTNFTLVPGYVSTLFLDKTTGDVYGNGLNSVKIF